MKKILLALSMLFFSQIVLADASTGTLTISRIETGWGSEGIYISTLEGSKVEGCSSATIFVNQSNALFKEILFMALSAYHSKAKVQFRVLGCDGSAMNATAIAVVN